MRVLPAADLSQSLDYDSLIDRIRDYLRSAGTAPSMAPMVVLPGDPNETGLLANDATLSLRPAWREGGYIGVGIATHFPANAFRDMPADMATFLLISGQTGEPLALLDGTELACRSRAAVSALGARYLARPDCERLLVVGAGALAPHLIRAHATQRPICNVLVWEPDFSRAEKIARLLSRDDFRVDASDDLESAVRGAHVICCAAGGDEPVLAAEWFQAGQFLSLLSEGAPDQRQVAGRLFKRAKAFADQRSQVLASPGDFADDLSDNEDVAARISGDLSELTRGDASGRNRYDDITVLKQMGLSLAELAAAKLAFERL